MPDAFKAKIRNPQRRGEQDQEKRTIDNRPLNWKRIRYRWAVMSRQKTGETQYEIGEHLGFPKEQIVHIKITLGMLRVRAEGAAGLQTRKATVPSSNDFLRCLLGRAGVIHSEVRQLFIERRPALIQLFQGDSLGKRAAAGGKKRQGAA